MLINTIYLLYKSNSKAAQNDAEALEKKIDVLTSKGKKRSEQESKDLKQYRKQLKEINGEVKEQEDAYNKLGTTLMRYAAGFASMSAITGGIFNASATNSALQVQSELIGQSTSALKAYGAAAEAAGGNSQEAIGYVQGLFEQFASSGIKLPEFEQVFSTIRRTLKEVGNDPALREMVFQKYNVPSGLKPLLSLPDEEFNAMIALQKDLAANTEKGAKIAREYHEEWSKTAAALDAVFTTAGTKVLPTLKEANKELREFLTFTSKNLELGIVEAVSYLLPAPLAAPLQQFFRNLRGKTTGSGETSEKTASNSSPAPYAPYSPSVLPEEDLQLNNTAGLTPAEKAAQLPEELEENIPTGGSIFNTPKKQTKGEISEESIRRGQEALRIANSTNLGMIGSNSIAAGSRNVSIKIGDVNVITQATDSKGIANSVSNDILSQISIAIANLDDGVSK